MLGRRRLLAPALSRLSTALGLLSTALGLLITALGLLGIRLPTQPPVERVDAYEPSVLPHAVVNDRVVVDECECKPVAPQSPINPHPFYEARRAEEPQPTRHPAARPELAHARVDEWCAGTASAPRAKRVRHAEGRPRRRCRRQRRPARAEWRGGKRGRPRPSFSRRVSRQHLQLVRRHIVYR